MEGHQDVSVVHLHDVLLERRDDVSKGHNNDSHQYVFTTSQTSLKWNTQRRLSGTLLRRLSGKHPRRPISRSLRRLLPNKTPKNVAVVRLHHVSVSRFRDVLLVSLYYTFEFLCHNFHLVCFWDLFKYQINHQIFLVPTRRETKRVVWIIN